MPGLIIKHAPTPKPREILSLSFFNGSRLKYSPEPYVKNRVVGSRPQDFLHISFANLKFLNDRNKEEFTRYIKLILTEGVEVGGKLFLFCGHSNSQLRSRSCCLFRANDHASVGAMINGLGDFGKIKDVGKRSKRVGLLFSSGEQFVYLQPEKTGEIEDIIREEKVFTDGCGLISDTYAQEIRTKAINQRGKGGYNIEYVPQVYQIRYQGYKGTLMVDTEKNMKRAVHGSLFQRFITWIFLIFSLSFLKDFWKNYTKAYNQYNQELKVVFRPSMKKFSESSSDELHLLEHSKPTTSAKLNAELVSILSSLGVPDEVFERRLQEYFGFIQNASESMEGAMDFLQYKGRDDMMRKAKKYYDHVWFQNDIKVSQRDELRASFDKNEIERVHIMIPQSRLLFGVCDSSGKLKPGQCFVKFTTDYNELTTSTLNGKLFVGRNPCLHPGDIQIFEAVNIPELNHLVDCIVFSTQGALPPASQMSGGDLDGDKFFVCWDQELIPPMTVDPFDYSTIQPNRPDSFQHEISQLDLIDYFANYSNGTLGQLTSLYSQWIRVNVGERAFSDECLRLNTLYSKCVDGEVVKIPEDLQHPPQPDPEDLFVLDKLIIQVKEVLDRQFAPLLKEFVNQGHGNGIQHQGRREGGLGGAPNQGRGRKRAGPSRKIKEKCESS